MKSLPPVLVAAALLVAAASTFAGELTNNPMLVFDFTHCRFVPAKLT